MRSSKKMDFTKTLGKGIPSLTFFLLLMIPISLAFDECHDAQPSDQIPCYIFLPSVTPCNNITVTFYNQSVNLSSVRMNQYSPAICSANFTYSTIGTYNFNYTTGDSGAIVVTEGNKMIYLIYFGLALIALLMTLGLWMQNQPMLLLNGLLMLVVSVWLFINGFSIFNNMLTQVVASVIFAAGAYFTVMSGLAMVEGD